MNRSTFLASGAAAGAAIAAPRFTLAAGPAATVKVGFIESFSGVFSDLGAYHKAGALLALEDANKSGRVKYEFAYGDDASKPAVATTEGQRLVSQENVDVLFGGTSSANGAALGALALQNGVFYLAIGAQDSALTGARASKLMYRFGPNARMILAPVLRRALALGKKWYFIQADYALGKDAYAQCSDALKRAGGTEVAHDIVPLGTTDFSSQLTKVATSGADVLMLCNSGLDAANTAKQWVQFGLNKKMRLAGVSLEDIYYKALPLDAVVGATFPVLWAPSVSPSAAKLGARMRKGISGPISGRHYLGYMAAMTLFDRIRAAGTTDAEKLAASFENYTFEAAKATRSQYHGCDHQCAQDVYAGASVSTKQFEKTQFMYDIVSEVPANESDGTCDSPWAKAATAAFATQKVVARQGYTAKTV
ncbi:ABC transporter substrate-binding protein [Vulcanimicrobium alpinum]|uniref:ABC transporter substrate-binding protein n=1 Tax=Vulcanimicrobium alpinum TaxID=3016050 RepID=A0AAN1XXD6_UNVUL|nr:ABC transporter substrate-binding protein [Vulcanimicrobium alpinum]BDE07141.1 ABC transporter substrate-binding protein [Vulcanimicrobium alpinum]